MPVKHRHDETQLITKNLKETSSAYKMTELTQLDSTKLGIDLVYYNTKFQLEEAIVISVELWGSLPMQVIPLVRLQISILSKELKKRK
jgi:hypothetical protein